MTGECDEHPRGTRASIQTSELGLLTGKQRNQCTSGRISAPLNSTPPEQRWSGASAEGGAAGAARIRHRRATERGWEEADGGVLGCTRELGSLCLGLRGALEADETREWARSPEVH
jgi:hypothetical protein